MTRNPFVAGKFYEADFGKLNKQIEDCFSHELGPGDFPIKKRKGFVKAIIAPHAGYMFSGPCAAWAYKELAESEPADLYLLIGPNHYGLGTSLSIEDWKTPFGIIKTDKDFVKELSEKTKIPINDSYHKDEHSIEVQLPFLQYASKDYLHSLKIACLTLSHDIEIDKLAEDLSEFLKKQKKKITIIVSSDFTHYGRTYGYLPFTLDVGKRLQELDKKAIDLVVSKNAKEFSLYIEKTGDTICGFLPIYLLLKTLANENGTLLIYYRSSEISGDVKNSVSYASIMFK